MALGDAIKALRQDIYLHVELRIQLFFQQLLISYKSGLEFAYFPTHLQAGLEDGKKWSHGKGDLQPTEAHCSTLPSLSCISRQAKIAYRTDGISLKPGIFFGGTSFEKISNTTIKLPECVNEIDSGIDFKKNYSFLNNKTFRDFCVDILNENARNELNPYEGLMLFLNAFKDIIVQKRKEENFLEPDLILNYYLSVIETYLKTDRYALITKLTLSTAKIKDTAFFERFQKEYAVKLGHEVALAKMVAMLRGCIFICIKKKDICSPDRDKSTSDKEGGITHTKLIDKCLLFKFQENLTEKNFLSRIILESIEAELKGINLQPTVKLSLGHFLG